MDIVLKNPIDMHVHLRQGAVMRAVLPFSALPFSAILAMPNTTPPLLNVKSALDYNDEIHKNLLLCKEELLDSKKVIESKNILDFTPIISLYVNDNLSQDDIKSANENGIKILKLYPKGATTNSENGLSEILTPHFLELLEIMQNLDMILSVHGESSGFSMERESDFLGIFRELTINFPRLKIIIEHLSDRRSIDFIHSHRNVFGTITLHHMLLTLDDILGGQLNPFAFCKPIVKTPLDREAILQIALSGDEKFSFGSDSAPHSMKAKLHGAAGIFSAPIALQGLCHIFYKHNKLENLQKFVSDNAMTIYDISLSFDKYVKITNTPCIFGKKIALKDSEDSNENSGISVFLGEERLDFSISEIWTTHF